MLDRNIQCLNCPVATRVSDAYDKLESATEETDTWIHQSQGLIDEHTTVLNSLVIGLRLSAVEILLKHGIMPTDDAIKNVEDQLGVDSVNSHASATDGLARDVHHARPDNERLKLKIHAVQLMLRRCTGPEPYGDVSPLGLRQNECHLLLDRFQPRASED